MSNETEYFSYEGGIAYTYWTPLPTTDTVDQFNGDISVEVNDPYYTTRQTPSLMASGYCGYQGGPHGCQFHGAGRGSSGFNKGYIRSYPCCKSTPTDHRPLVSFFLAGISQVFQIGFGHYYHTLKSARKNLRDTIHHPEVVEGYLAAEISQHQAHRRT